MHELLAQAITYDALGLLPAEVSARLRGIFTAIEERQPEIYKLPQQIKSMAGRIDWPLVLDAARQEIGVPQADGFDLSSGVKSLLCRSAAGAPT